MTRSELRKIKKGLELINVLIQGVVESNSISSVMNYRDTIHHIFYNGNSFDELFLYIFPVVEIEDITRCLLVIKTSSGTSGNDELFSSYGKITKEVLIDRFNRIKLHMETAISSHGFKVFCSWQSDLKNGVNRSFIENSLQSAIKLCNKELNLPINLDKDTTNRTGSPDIASTILEKIDDSFMFVADITIVSAPDANGKKSPNPNVIFELGYAQGVIGEENIVLVFNNAFGSISDLPFDLRGRRIIQYTCPLDTSSEEKKAQKEVLINHLKSAIKTRSKIEIE